MLVSDITITSAVPTDKNFLYHCYWRVF